MQLHFSHNHKMRLLADLLGLNKTEVAGFDLPAGYTCPMANLCKSFANPNTGRIVDAKSSLFRCYAATIEAAFPNSRKAHWANYDLLRGKSVFEMTDIILDTITKKMKIIRIHTSGDFFSRDYFDAWRNAAYNRPEISFFAYSKILDYVKADKPDNFRMVYSMGGLQDDQRTIEQACYVVDNPGVADKMGLPVACREHPADDYTFFIKKVSFAITLHGCQPKGAHALRM